MIKRYLLLYFFIITALSSLGLVAWETNRYSSLKKEVTRLEKAQADWVMRNKRHIENIAVLSSPGVIESRAKQHLGLRKVRPEEVLQVRLREEKGNGR